MAHPDPLSGAAEGTSFPDALWLAPSVYAKEFGEYYTMPRDAPPAAAAARGGAREGPLASPRAGGAALGGGTPHARRPAGVARGASANGRAKQRSRSFGGGARGAAAAHDAPPPAAVASSRAFKSNYGEVRDLVRRGSVSNLAAARWTEGLRDDRKAAGAGVASAASRPPAKWVSSTKKNVGWSADPDEPRKQYWQRLERQRRQRRQDAQDASAAQLHAPLQPEGYDTRGAADGAALPPPPPPPPPPSNQSSWPASSAAGDTAGQGMPHAVHVEHERAHREDVRGFDVAHAALRESQRVHGHAHAHAVHDDQMPTHARAPPPARAGGFGYDAPAFNPAFTRDPPAAAAATAAAPTHEMPARAAGEWPRGEAGWLHAAPAPTGYAGQPQPQPHGTYAYPGRPAQPHQHQVVSERYRLDGLPDSGAHHAPPASARIHDSTHPTHHGGGGTVFERKGNFVNHQHVAATGLPGVVPWERHV